MWMSALIPSELGCSKPRSVQANRKERQQRCLEAGLPPPVMGSPLRLQSPLVCKEPRSRPEEAQLTPPRQQPGQSHLAKWGPHSALGSGLSRIAAAAPALSDADSAAAVAASSAAAGSPWGSSPGEQQQLALMLFQPREPTATAQPALQELGVLKLHQGNGGGS